jgi:hypothetical protein
VIYFLQWFEYVADFFFSFDGDFQMQMQAMYAAQSAYMAAMQGHQSQLGMPPPSQAPGTPSLHGDAGGSMMGHPHPGYGFPGMYGMPGQMPGQFNPQQGPSGSPQPQFGYGYGMPGVPGPMMRPPSAVSERPPPSDRQQH